MSSASAQAPAVLRCLVSYGGTTHTIDTPAGTDPYAAVPVDIEERFLFKAVVRGSGRRVDAVRIYVYQATDGRPLLLHDARYLPPFAPGRAPMGLTGEHTVYAGALERQLSYGCALT